MKKFLLRLFGKVIATKCGHVFDIKGEVVVFGKKVLYGKNSGKESDYCPECEAKAAIRCGLCGNIIFAGSLIALYPWPLPEVIAAKVTLFKGEGTCIHVGAKNLSWVVVCAGIKCSDQGTLISGSWVMPGRVKE